MQTSPVTWRVVARLHIQSGCVSHVVYVADQMAADVLSDRSRRNAKPCSSQRHPAFHLVSVIRWLAVGRHQVHIVKREMSIGR